MDGVAALMDSEKMGKRTEMKRRRPAALDWRRSIVKKTLRGGNYLTREGQHASNTLVAHVETITPPIVLLRDFGLTKQAEDALSLMGLKAQDENELMDVSSPFKPTSLPINASREEMENTTVSIGQIPVKKSKAKFQLKKMAREKGKVKGLAPKTQVPLVGSKRVGKLIFEDEKEEARTKKRCTEIGILQPNLVERSAVAAVQRCREQ